MLAATVIGTGFHTPPCYFLCTYFIFCSWRWIVGGRLAYSSSVFTLFSSFALPIWILSSLTSGACCSACIFGEVFSNFLHFQGRRNLPLLLLLPREESLAGNREDRREDGPALRLLPPLRRRPLQKDLQAGIPLQRPVPASAGGWKGTRQKMPSRWFRHGAVLSHFAWTQ